MAVDVPRESRRLRVIDTNEACVDELHPHKDPPANRGSVSPESCGEVLAESVTVPSCDAYGATSVACARATDVVTAIANKRADHPRIFALFTHVHFNSPRRAHRGVLRHSVLP